MRTKRDTDPGLTFNASAPAGQWSDSYVIQLLTPMVGGGTESWQIDKSQPIRTSEIKQQLRFWWRTIQNPAKPMDELWKQESAIFGNSEGASRVRLQVEPKAEKAELLQITIGQNGRCDDWKGLPGYVLFPLLGQKDDEKKRITEFTLLKSYSFILSVTCPVNDKASIENAVALWLLFGGLGARTRRGAGSLYCEKIHNHPDFQDSNTAGQALRDIVKKIWPPGETSVAPYSSSFPVLRGGKLVWRQVQNGQDAIQAWDALLGNHITAWTPPGLGDLRQANGLARAGKFGRSYWPEADTLRRKTGIYSAAHDPKEHFPPPSSQLPDSFPRAAYGLPLNFKFTNKPTTTPGNQEPAPNKEFSFEILPQNGERWPSSIILKVVKLGNRVFQIALLLNQRIPEMRCEYNRDALKEMIEDQIKAGGPPCSGGTPGPIAGEQHPNSFSEKKLPSASRIPRDGHPHDGLLARLFPGVTPHVL